MLGYAQNELVGMKIHTIDAQLDIEEIDAMAKNEEMGKTVMFDTKHKTKDGRILDVQVSTTYFKFDDMRFGIALVKEMNKQMNKGNLADE